MNDLFTSEKKGFNELHFSRTPGYFDKSVTIRMLIVLFFSFFLFLFLHFREPYVEKLELGNQAKKYVVAQIDFAFPDEEATVILKQEAAREIGTIFRIAEDVIQSKISLFQKFMTQNEEGSRKWGELSHESGFDDIATALHLFVDMFSQTRFTDVRTIQRMETFSDADLPIPIRYFFPYLPTKMKGKLPSKFWTFFEKKFFEGIPKPISQFLFDYFKEVEWTFEPDGGLEYTLRKLAQAKIPEKYTKVRAGERIVDQGEKVTSRHMTMIQAMKETIYQQRNLFDPITVGGTLLMTILLVGIVGYFLKTNHPDLFYSNQKLSLLTTVLLLTLLLAKGVEFFLINHTNHFIDLVRFPLFAPFAAILIGTLIHVRIASFSTIFLILIFEIGLPVESVSFFVVNLLTAVVAILALRMIRRRKEIFMISGKAWLVSATVVLAFHLYENQVFKATLVTDLVSTFLFMGVSAVLIVGLLPVFESLFQIMTDMTLMEFLDPSHELLRRLALEAPGTYQHSIVVGHLAEAGATAIGANGLFCRVATQYHDIGKLANPQYFTENQLGGMDLHQLLTFLESAQVIIAHVSEGVALARKASLPEPFIDIIKEHHGTTLVYYFYHKQIELNGGDKSKVDEHHFRYSGPLPHSKESTIIMIADTLEAASRSLDEFNEGTVVELVESLIAHKLEDGQFNDSVLTFEELKRVKEALIKTLIAASHPRVKYPPHHPGEEG